MTENTFRRVVVVDPVDWPDVSSEEINSKLLKACTLRHVPIARAVLSEGADVNCRGSDSLTPLHISAEHGDVELVKLLCDQPSVKIDSKTMHGLTPLHTAAFVGNTKAIEMLLDRGADVNCKDNLDRCPLHYAILQRDIASTHVLIKNNANINIYDIFHECPLYTSVIRSPCLAMIKILLSHGASITSAPYKNSLGLLLEAILSSHKMIDGNAVKLLFQHGESINTTDFIGARTPLHLTAMNGDITLAKYLIEHGANLYARNRAGLTPMEVAISYRNFDIAHLIENALLEKPESRLVRSTQSFTS